MAKRQLATDNGQQASQHFSIVTFVTEV